jgi:hypothetical protein
VLRERECGARRDALEAIVADLRVAAQLAADGRALIGAGRPA